MPPPPRRILSLRQDDFFEDPRQRLLVYRRKSQQPYRQHRHEFFEIAVILSGTGQHVTGSHRQTVRRGDVFVLNNRRVHGYRQTERLGLVNILIREDLLHQLAPGLEEIAGYAALFGTPLRHRAPYSGHLHLPPRDLEQVEAGIAAIERELSVGQPGGLGMAEAHLALIIGLLSRRYGQTPASPPAPSEFADLAQALEARLAYAWSVPGMARHAGMSERTFHRAFKTAMGAPPGVYLHHLRLRKAATLLRETSASITELAQQVGFADSNHFSRAFRHLFGINPRAYRHAP